MSYKKIFNRLVIFSTLLLAAGIFLIIYSHYHNCSNIIAAAIEDNNISGPLKGQQNAIYLIRDVNTSCRPCSKYDILRKVPNIHIIFYVKKDYSDNDISNFRDVFDIPGKYIVERISDEWQQLYEKCNPKMDKQFNILIQFDKDGKIIKLLRF